MVLRLEPTWEMMAKCHVDDIAYWTWLSPTLIAIVNDKHVLHWDVTRGGVPVQLFQRHQRLAFSEVISYKADEDMRWFAVTGLLPQVGELMLEVISYSNHWPMGDAAVSYKTLVGW